MFLLNLNCFVQGKLWYPVYLPYLWHLELSSLMDTKKTLFIFIQTDAYLKHRGFEISTSAYV